MYLKNLFLKCLAVFYYTSVSVLLENYIQDCNDQCIFHILTSVEINDFILCLIHKTCPQCGSCYVGNPDLLFGNCKFHASGLKTISMYGKFNPFVELC